ncbi:DUF58 domain-containing protein [Motilibacter aurantiacus]|uniref:DUF58 domain-containing protein n=1 Tax=Motilibacter aurantiacus TaxID=2714955 RepID=UPI001408ECEE|nr:DUF58 domain-containing protein [Motilibacter aurantiacus]NHC45004.1 DUF58 domain-containing protein [Motilibacter aurantiacus]
MPAELGRDLSKAQALRRLELTITRRLEGLLHGEHLGLLPGVGSEPAESREYRAGEDDVRRMDWAVTARTAVPHVRDLLADHELVTTVALDASASMDFGTAAREKRDVAVGAVAAFGFLTQRGGNRLGAYARSAGAELRWPARSGREALLALLTRLAALPRGEARPGARTSLAELAAGASAQARRRGLIVLVSDFLDPDVAEWERAVRRLAVRHDVVAVEVLDPRELELPDVGLLTLVDPETGRRREVWTGSRRLRERYAAAAAQQRADTATALGRAGARHLRLRTDGDWVADVARFALATRRGAAYSRPARAGEGAAHPTLVGSGA